MESLSSISEMSRAEAVLTIGRLLMARMDPSARDEMREAWGRANEEYNYDIRAFPKKILKALLVHPARLGPIHAEKLASFSYLNGLNSDYFGLCLKVKSLVIYDFYLQLSEEFETDPDSRGHYYSYHVMYGVNLTLSQHPAKFARGFADKENTDWKMTNFQFADRNRQFQNEWNTR